jgi:preprotein translocase subunit YajC
MNITRTILMLGGAALLPAVALAQSSPAASDATASQPASPGTAAAPASSTAPAASTASITAGTKVLDTAGGTAGTIESVDGDFVVLATTKSKVRLPKSSFAMGPNGPVIAMTAAQIDTAAAQAAPTAAAAAPTKVSVTPGAAVSDTKGGAVGTVASVSGQIATVSLTGGSKVRLPVTAFGAGSGGGLQVAMTAAQLSAAAGAAK